MKSLRTTAAMLGALALAGSLATSAAATSEPEEPPMSVDLIEGVTWILARQAVEGQLQELPEAVTVSLLMQDGRAGGTGGCNSYFTDYQLDGSQLSFGMVGSTEMACLPPVMDVEQAYFANLGAVASYQTTGGPMSLLDAAGEIILEFEVAPEATVVGSWVAQGINNGDAVESNEFTSLVTAEFDGLGLLSGSDGCNQYSTSYEVEGDAITIAPEIATTLRLCEPEALGELSAQYFAALTAATTWMVDPQGSLELRDDSGALQVRYVPAE